MPKLSLLEKVGYGLGDTASNLFFQTFIFFLVYFYTDVFGISAAAAGTMFLVTRIWDAINDPIMGAIADRTNTRWGKFRPYLLWFAVPFGVIGFLMFSTPDLGPTGKLVYAYITYTLMMMVYTAINVPYSALMGVISPNSSERTVVSAFRFGLAFIGMFIAQYAVVRLVEFFGRGDEVAGWRVRWDVLALAAVLLRLPLQPQGTGQAAQKLHYTGTFGIRQCSWLPIGSATIVQLIFIVMRNAASCIFEYYIRRQMTLMGGTSLYLIIRWLLRSYYLKVQLSRLSARFDQVVQQFRQVKHLRQFSVLVSISGLMYFINPHQIGLLFLLQLITSAGRSVSVLQWAIYTDTADYSEWEPDDLWLWLWPLLFAQQVGSRRGVSGVDTGQLWICAEC